MKIILWILMLLFPIGGFAAEANYSSHIMNQSKRSGSNGYVLVKTRVWPESGCVIDSGKAILAPGENSQLIVMNKKECDQAGVGYSLYNADDKDKKHLLGYVSHRFRDGRFSLQVSVFCEGSQCVFRDLNPEQHR